MKYFKTLRKYKASNLEYDTDSGLAYSYGWYLLGQRKQGYYLLNTYNYSPTTVGHYKKLRKVLDALLLPVVELEAPNGLQDLDTAILYYINKITELEQQIARPLSKAGKNNKRLEQIGNYLTKIHQVKQIKQDT